MNSRSLLWIALFTALTAMSGWIRIPMVPVPFTLQTLCVYLAGSLLGPMRGAASQVLFLAIGLMGAPVFSGGGGPAYITYPTFGYLLGFPIAAWTIGLLFRSHTGSRLKSGLRYLAGTGVIHGMGLLYLITCFNRIAPAQIALSRLILTGSLIFMPGEILKICASILLHRRLARYVEPT